MTAPAHICVICTGGTLGMAQSEQGYTPQTGFLESQLKLHPAFQHASMPSWDWVEYQPALDSSNMTPALWNRLADDVAAALQQERIAGVVVIHGTDTMAYTASALSFLLADLDKPVVLTGSQVPLCEPRSDAVRNLVGAMQVAACGSIPEVGVFFNHAFYRGVAVRKMHAASYEAFDSPNQLPLADAGVSLQIHNKRLRQAGAGVNVLGYLCADVGLVWLFPGIQADAVAAQLNPLRGVVLLGYGMGNAPSQDEALKSVLKEAHQRGVVMIAGTQCVVGDVQLGNYETGHSLAQCGVLEGRQQTPEALLTKLMYLLSDAFAFSADEIRSYMQQDLRGELS